MAFRILVVDDEQTLRESVVEVLSEEGHVAEGAGDGAQAMQRLEAAIDQGEAFDVVVTDIRMPRMDGVELIERVAQLKPTPTVIIMTAYASLETAIKALRAGVHDYLIKPINFDELLVRLERLEAQRAVIEEVQTLKQEVARQYGFDHMVGASAPMQEVFRLVNRVARSRGTVLITGKSGTGKELIARAIHYGSDRAKGRFVALNCGAIPESLFESELFGHKKGAFTGAQADRSGFFTLADGGSLFLDEVGEIPLNLQVKLLRAIEEREVIPVGGTRPIKTDARIIAATNKDLEREVEAGRFREDLYYRLNVVHISLPALNDRREDIPDLVAFFIDRFNADMGRQMQGIAPEALRLLSAHDWKGSVRELENAIERAMIFSSGPMLTVADLPPNLRPAGSGGSAPVGVPDDLREAIKQFEKRHLETVMRRLGGDKEASAVALGIGLSSLYRKLDEHELQIPRS